MQIRTRLTLQFTLIVATMLVIVCVAIYLSAEQYRVWHFRSRVEAKMLTTANRYSNVQAFDTQLLKLVDSTKKDLVP
ncbi:MAG: two-component sensor histidine kinase, partial [Bacteroidia bacterium]